MAYAMGYQRFSRQAEVDSPRLKSWAIKKVKVEAEAFLKELNALYKKDVEEFKKTSGVPTQSRQ